MLITQSICTIGMRNMGKNDDQAIQILIIYTSLSPLDPDLLCWTRVPRSLLPTERFDASFYRRFYLDRQHPRGNPGGDRRPRRPGRGVRAATANIGVSTILDVGCGLGLMREKALEQHFPQCPATRVSRSAATCASGPRLGARGWAATFASGPGPSISWSATTCLQYLTAPGRGRGGIAQPRPTLRGRAALRGADDPRTGNSTATGGAPIATSHIRPGVVVPACRLAPAFINAGSGMFVRRGAPIHLWELDRVEVLRSRRGYNAWEFSLRPGCKAAA